MIKCWRKLQSFQELDWSLSYHHFKFGSRFISKRTWSFRRPETFWCHRHSGKWLRTSTRTLRSGTTMSSSSPTQNAELPGPRWEPFQGLCQRPHSEVSLKHNYHRFCATNGFHNYTPTIFLSCITATQPLVQYQFCPLFWTRLWNILMTSSCQCWNCWLICFCFFGGWNRESSFEDKAVKILTFADVVWDGIWTSRGLSTSTPATILSRKKNTKILFCFKIKLNFNIQPKLC